MRRLPLGLLVPLFVLYPLRAGLRLVDVGLLFAALTCAVVLCELPTGGLADSWGRRRTLILAAGTGVVSLVLMLVADSLAVFLLAFAATGVYWALDSGPLAAWYVDAVSGIEPGRDLTGDLSQAELAENIAIAAGSLTVSALAVVRLPVDGLTAAVAVALGVQVAYLVAVSLLIGEVVPAHAEAPRVSVLRTMRSALRVGWGRSVRLLLAAQVLLGAGLSTVELLWQPVTAARAGGRDWIFGVVAAGGWAVRGVGAVLLPPIVRALGGKVVRAAGALRACQGLAMIPLALTGGPVWMVAGYLATYLLQGPTDGAHATLLHRHAQRTHRATLLSLNSLVLRASGLVTSASVGALATLAGPAVAFAGAAAAFAAAAPLYLLSGEPAADRHEPAATGGPDGG